MASSPKSTASSGPEKRRWTPASDTVRTRGGRSTARVLNETTAFGPNPGALRMLSYAPKELAAGSGLVVVLHGCTQTAKGYDDSAGWTALADELGFAVLYPEQTRSNNPAGCFNWFLPADKSRGLGEARSIRDMIEAMAERHAIDRSRVFVTGLSAGGAMAAALLADYPEVFSAGAIIAGLPCGAAASMQEAFRAMERPDALSPADLGDAVRTGSAHPGPWPRVMIWHGSADATVAPRNADELVKQWLDVHGLEAEDVREGDLPGARRRVWSRDGADLVESVTLDGFGHGAPLDARFGERKAPHMMEAGVSSTRRIAVFFGLGQGKPHAAPETRTRTADAELGRSTARETLAGKDARRRFPGLQAGGVGGIITRALRSAGLMK